MFPQDMSSTVLIDDADLDAGAEEIEPARSFTLDSPHTGFAVPMADGGALVTEGGGESIARLVAVEEDGSEAESAECPGGEGVVVARGEAVVSTCHRFLLVHRDREFTTIALPDEEATVSALADHPDSPVVLATYRGIREGTHDTLDVALVDTASGALDVVEIGVPIFYYDGLARGPEGEGLAFSEDGVLRVIDVTTGEITDEIEVMDAWEISTKDNPNGQEPSMSAVGSYVYINDDRSDTLHKIDLARGEVVDSVELPHHTRSVLGVSGEQDG